MMQAIFMELATALTDVTGGFHPNLLPPRTAMPAATLQRVGRTPTDGPSREGKGSTKRQRLQITLWATTAEEASRLAADIETHMAALAAHPGAVGIETAEPITICDVTVATQFDTQDPTTGRPATVTDYWVEWHIH